MNNMYIYICSHIHGHLDDLLDQKNDRKREITRSLKYNGQFTLRKKMYALNFYFLSTHICYR